MIQTLRFSASSVIGLAVLLAACNGSTTKPTPTQTPGAGSDPVAQTPDAEPVTETHSNSQFADRFYAGVDMSYVNEMEDCGAEYRVGGRVEDPFKIFADAGSNLVRVRLWHNPTWTEYSDLADVKKIIRRAKQQGQTVLLDFHYSDTWADPEKQFIPAAWEHLFGDTEALGDALADYTYDVLTQLKTEDILPEMVQVGNETNAEILQPEAHMKHGDIDWERNAYLLNRGIAAVNRFNQEHGTAIERVLHIAQPENGLWWFQQAAEAGVIDFDIIGLSYYGKWSTYKPDSVGEAIRELRETHGKDVMVVETAYPWTLQNFDNANNVLGEDSLLTGYPATPAGQKQYMLDLGEQVMSAGGIGLVYWEPAWVSTRCSTLWGEGSHWENATFFDAGNGNEALPAMQAITEMMATFRQ